MIQGYNPRTGQPTGEPVAETTDADVDAAVAAAAEALPAWASLDDEARAHALDALADALDERAAELVALADAETALGETRLTGEVGRTTGQLRLFAGVLRDGGYHDVADSPAGGGIAEIGRISHAIGPVVVFAASNFPFAFSVLGGDTASALAAGCPVVVKAHEGHPNTSELTAQIAHEVLAKAGAPHGVFALVHGVDAGLRLLNHPDIAAAGFTGSTSRGLALAKISADREVPIPFFGELGAVNPVVVLPGAATQRAADIASGYAGSLTLGAGQFCTNPGLLFVPAQDENLRGAIADAVSGSSGAPMLSERIHSGYEAALAEIEAHPAVTSVAAGATGEGPWAATPRLFATTLAEFAGDLPVLAKERFGPAGLLITYPSPEELLPVLARLGGNLVGSIHGDPDDRPTWSRPGRSSRCSSAPWAGSCGTAGPPGWRSTRPSTTAARTRPPPRPPPPRSARPRSGGGWCRWPTRGCPRSCARPACRARWPRPRAEPVPVATYLYPWDVDGDPGAADRIAALGVTEVSLAAAYHAVRAVTPFHPGHRIVTRDAAVYYRPDLARWAGAHLRPAGPDPAGVGSFERAADALRAAGLQVNAWVVVTHNGRLAAAHPECAVHNAFGDAYPWALCAGSPAVAEYAAALAAEIAALDAVADVELEACGWYGYDHGSAHDKTGGTPAGPGGPVAGHLLLRRLHGHAAGGRGGLRGHRGRGPDRPRRWAQRPAGTGGDAELGPGGHGGRLPRARGGGGACGRPRPADPGARPPGPGRGRVEPRVRADHVARPGRRGRRHPGLPRPGRPGRHRGGLGRPGSGGGRARAAGHRHAARGGRPGRRTPANCPPRPRPCWPRARPTCGSTTRAWPRPPTTRPSVRWPPPAAQREVAAAIG